MNQAQIDPENQKLKDLKKEFRLHGFQQAAKGITMLTAGKLSLIYDNGSLRYISDGRNEIIRMIYFALRDREWLTIAPEISGENVTVNGSEFIITYKAEYRSGEIHFRALFSIEGKNDNTVIFSCEGEAVSSFLKNRIGFCLLHPSDSYAGKPCSITHTDGTIEGTGFPEMISPHQLFMDIRSMRWQTDGAVYTAYFQGDIFETEDQRNWTDASFKTYSTPLSIPFPARIEKGSVVAQKVILKGENIPLRDPKNENTIRITIDSENGKKIPPVGISSSSRPQLLTEGEIRILRSVHFDHYRIELNLDSPYWQVRADASFREAENLMLPVELVMFFDDNARDQVNSFRGWASEQRSEIRVVLVFHKNEAVTPGWLCELVIPVLRELFPGVRTGAGTNASFVEINRKQPGICDSDLICYSVHPQEHASDNLTLVENLAGQSETVASAAVIAGWKGVWVSPVTIQRRFNANREYCEIPHSGPEFPPQADSRLLSLFGACWTAGSLKHLLESDVAGVTYFESAGERGIFQGEYSSRWPAEFPAVTCMVFPVFFVFRFLLRNKSMKLVKSISSDKLSVESLALTDGKRIKMIVFNYTYQKKEIRISGCTGLLKLRRLSEDTYGKVILDLLWSGEEEEITVNCRKSVSLEPYSIYFIEGWLTH